MRRLIGFCFGVISLCVLAGPAAADPAPTAVEIEYRRSEFGLELRGCLPDVRHQDTGTFLQPGVATVSVNGVPVDTVTDAVTWGGAVPEGTEDICPGNVHVDYRLTNEAISNAGVAIGPEWAAFDVAIAVDVAGHPVPFDGRRQVWISNGAPIGTFTSFESTPKGTVVRGNAALPAVGGSPFINVFVDGRRTYPLFRAEGDYYYIFKHAGRANLPTTISQWNQWGLGDMTSFEFLVPPGQVCLSAGQHEGSTDAVPLGCVTTSGNPTAEFNDVTVTAKSGSPYSQVTVRGTISDPWAEPGTTPLIVASGAASASSISVVAAPDLAGPHGNGTGIFRFEHTYDQLYPRAHRLCMNQWGSGGGQWWSEWSAQRPSPVTGLELGCTVVDVPTQRPPIGSLDSVVADRSSLSAGGWALDPNGGAPRVLLVVDGRQVALGRSGLARLDVQGVHGGDGLSGWMLSAEGLSPGNHTVCAHWEDTGTGQWSAAQCRNVVVK